MSRKFGRNQRLSGRDGQTRENVRTAGYRAYRSVAVATCRRRERKMRNACEARSSDRRRTGSPLNKRVAAAAATCSDDGNTRLAYGITDDVGYIHLLVVTLHEQRLHTTTAAAE